MQLEKIKHVALDMDGTIYLGDTLFRYTDATSCRPKTYAPSTSSTSSRGWV